MTTSISVVCEPESKPANHKCCICGDCFQEIDELEEHKTDAHPVEAYYKCRVCDIVYRNRNLLEKHFEIHTKKRKKECFLVMFVGKN